MPDQVWCESELLPQTAPAESKTRPARQTAAELAQVCREQAEELEGGQQHIKTCMPSGIDGILCCRIAKDVIINQLKRKLSSLEATVST